MITERKLKVALTPQEKSDLLDELSAVCVERNKWEAERKKMAGVFNERIKSCKVRQSDLSEATSSGLRQVMVDCDERVNLEQGVMETYRIDTGEVLESRPLEPDELGEVAKGDEEETE